MMSSKITRLNLGKRNLHWCTFGAAISHQLMTTCVCANLLNKCSSQSRVLFRVQQHTTLSLNLVLTGLAVLFFRSGFLPCLILQHSTHKSQTLSELLASVKMILAQSGILLILINLVHRGDLNNSLLLYSVKSILVIHCLDLIISLDHFEVQVWCY